ncbi:hypothetical protein LK542_08920 [Massilia sp. IC2-477]|uniref:hypothetical protein n=1 Tax=Massilia sp. IC2-477 TaxID=2887198 RepID=UPI001D12286F|nr:hypothetical protein [Massilia sp. IC2-477]MCC2955735.1 hypothetical protein [Massilia sp. IC2-477]
MFIQNDVLEYAGPPVHAIRILWIDSGGLLAYVFPLGQASALPRPLATAALAADVAARRARLLLADPHAARPPAMVADKHRRLQMKAWEAVRSLHAQLPALYLQAQRPALVAACAEAQGMSKASVMRYLRRYWERGQTPDALWPDYLNSGAPGKTRAANPGVKRGRPRKGEAAGANVDGAMRALFRAAVARYAATHAAFSRQDAYRQMLEEFFRGHDIGTLPSYGQFCYWLERDGLVGDTLPSQCVLSPEWCSAAK